MKRKWTTFSAAREEIDAYGGALEHRDGKWRWADPDDLDDPLRATLAAYVSAGLSADEAAREVAGWCDREADGRIVRVPAERIRAVAEEVTK